MPTEHVNITDGNGTTTSERHEPKGASIASAGQVYQADGAGSGSWAFFENTYGGIYTVEGDALTEGSIGTTPIKAEIFANNGPSNNVTVDATNNQMTVTVAGDYYIVFAASFATVAAGDAGTYQFHVRVNGVESVIGTHRDLSGSTDIGSLAAHGMLTLAANDVLTVYVESDDAGTDDITVYTASLSAVLLKRA